MIQKRFVRRIVGPSIHRAYTVSTGFHTNAKSSDLCVYQPDGYCIKTAMGLRTANLDDDQMTAQLQRLVPINLGSVCVAALGLMMVVIGILL